MFLNLKFDIQILQTVGIIYYDVKCLTDCFNFMLANILTRYISYWYFPFGTFHSKNFPATPYFNSVASLRLANFNSITQIESFANSIFDWFLFWISKFAQEQCQNPYQKNISYPNDLYLTLLNLIWGSDSDLYNYDFIIWGSDLNI